MFLRSWCGVGLGFFVAAVAFVGCVALAVEEFGGFVFAEVVVSMICETYDILGWEMPRGERCDESLERRAVVVALEVVKTVSQLGETVPQLVQKLPSRNVGDVLRDNNAGLVGPEIVCCEISGCHQGSEWASAICARKCHGLKRHWLCGAVQPTADGRRTHANLSRNGCAII